jgi:hypothetical protein
MHIDAANERPGEVDRPGDPPRTFTGHLPGSAESGQSRPGIVSFLVSYIHVHRASIGVHRSSLSRHMDLHGRSWMVILNPEKRKVGGSAPPLTTTTSDQAILLGEDPLWHGPSRRESHS